MNQVWEWITGAISFFLGALKSAVGGLVARVLGAFGLSLVTFNGLLPDLKSFLGGYLSSLPPEILNLASAVGLDVAMTMVISALTVRMAWSVFVVPTTVKDALQAPPQ